VMLALPLPQRLLALPLLTGMLRVGAALLFGCVFFSLAERPFLPKK
jgi:hypothetical protein